MHEGLRSEPTRHGDAPLLAVRGLRKSFPRSGGGRSGRAVVVDGVSFEVRAGEVVALVGESGSGKSTLAKIVARLERFEGGAFVACGEEVTSGVSARASRGYRQRVQLVFQDPFASLSPLHTVGEHVARPLELLGSVPEAERPARVLAVLRSVGLEPAESFVARMPHELSGGQRQRVAIARAIAAEPRLLVADEPTSMLDVSLRAGVLDLLDRLRRERNLGVLLITHDLAAARQLADRILVLYRGSIVEDGPAEAVIERPLHPYTAALVEAVRGDDLAGAHALHETPAAATRGCRFAPRCPRREARCEASEPEVQEISERHRVRCHLVSVPNPERSPT